MDTQNTASEKQRVLVRHVIAGKRGNIRNIENLLKTPFADSAGGTDGGTEDVSILGYANGRCAIAGRFAGHSWAPMYSNAATAEELFQANAANRKLEVAFVGCSAQGGWFFRLNRAGKRVVQFSQPAERPPSVCELVGVDSDVVIQGESGEQNVARLCEHFEITWPMPEIRILDDGFEVLDATGRPLTSGLRGFLRLDGPAIAAGENIAADALAAAIDDLDSDAIRAAIGQGAPLTVLPDYAGSPLMAALSKYDDDAPEWQECVELLLELGCPVNGIKGDPPIVECVDERFFEESDALQVAELLLAHGADVNAADREGMTALHTCVLDKRVELVKFLLEQGADPNIKNRTGVSAVDWLRARNEDKTQNFGERTQCAELLSLLTGKRVAKPKAKDLSPALAAENERFRQCIAARQMLPLLKANITLRGKDSPPYARSRWFREWQQQLFDAGFKLAQHFSLGLSDQSAYTHADLGYDALLSEGDKPHCDLIAYHGDGTTSNVANFADVAAAGLTPAWRNRQEFVGESPAQLVEHLRELVGGKEVLPIDGASFGPRFTAILNRLAHGAGELAQRVLETPSILIDGVPPRYERLGCYLDFSDRKDPGYSCDDFVRYWVEQFSKADSEPPDSTSDALQAAVWLVAICHMQFASAPDANDFLAPGSDFALAHFEAIRRAPKDCVKTHAWFQIQSLLYGLLLCALAGRWQTFKAVCDLVQPKLMSAKRDEYDDLDYAEVLLLFVSSHRDEALPKVAALEKSIRKRLAKRPRLLLDICQAIGTGKAADLTEALRASLENFLEERGKPVGSKANNLFHYISLPESLFHLAAIERGLPPPALPPHLAELLITPDTIGVPAKG